jgi:hypothetical protein
MRESWVQGMGNCLPQTQQAAERALLWNHYQTFFHKPFIQQLNDLYGFKLLSVRANALPFLHHV